jgi:hypothetical protein
MMETSDPLDRRQTVNPNLKVNDRALAAVHFHYEARRP